MEQRVPCHSAFHIGYPFPLPWSFKAIDPFPKLCVAFDNMLVFYGEQMLAHRKIMAWKTTLYRLSATDYSIRSHLLPRIYPKFENASPSGDSRPVIKYRPQSSFGMVTCRLCAQLFRCQELPYELGVKWRL